MVGQQQRPQKAVLVGKIVELQKLEQEFLILVEKLYWSCDLECATGLKESHIAILRIVPLNRVLPGRL